MATFVTEGNLGEDMMIDGDLDIIAGLNGDLQTTEDVEATLGTVPFKGSVCINEILYRRFGALKGSHPFDFTFGTNIQKFVSKTMSKSNMEELQKVIEEDLNTDERIKTVDSVIVEKRDTNKLTVSISITVIGQSASSPFTFPYRL